ncbi:hypothetical protein QE436_003454 [Pantoea anthophila]|nr:hypothetical protein [Pantoea anthophila]
MPEEQSVHARDGVADPQGCGNPLRSGVAGLSIAAASPPHPSAAKRPIQKKRQAGFPLTCRFCNEPQLMPDNLLVVFGRVVFVFRFRCNLFIVRIRFRRNIILAFRHAAVD